MKFKYYECKLHGKIYKIYIPFNVPKNSWIEPVALYGTWYWSDFFNTDRYGIQCIQYTSVILSSHSDVIVYFPIRDNIPIDDSEEKDWQFDILFYNSSIQFKRSKWKQIKKMLSFTKEQIVTIKCNEQYMLRKAEHSQKQWDYKEVYKYYRKPKIDSIERFERNKVFFVECKSQIEHYIEWKKLYEFLKRDDLDGYYIRHNSCASTYAYCFGIEYITREEFKIRKELDEKEKK